MAILWLSESQLLPHWIMNVAVILAWAQWLAAGLDAVENAALLLMLLDGPVEPWPQLAFWCATIKFSLVAVGLLFVLIALTSFLVRRARGGAAA